MVIEIVAQVKVKKTFLVFEKKKLDNKMSKKYIRINLNERF